MLKSLQSEDELRTELIIPLFRKMGYQAIDNQGPNEYGTDVILKQANNLGSDEFTSIVLKKDDINNKAGNKSGVVRIIFDQILQAAKSAIDHPEVKKNTYPNYVWLITNGKISSNAKSIFHKMLTEKFETTANIEYLDRDKLIFLIDEHWPEFYKDRRPFLSQYSDLLRDELVGVNVSEIGESDKSVDSILIPQLLNEKKDFGESTTSSLNIKKTPLTPIQLESVNSSVIFIVGEAGSGKSTLLKRLAIDLVEKGTSTPIIINARKFSLKKIDIREVYKEVFRDENLSSPLDDIQRELSEVSICLLVDALDEVRTAEERCVIVKNLIQLVEDPGNNIKKVIISSRPESDSDLISLTRKYKSYQVLPVKNSQVSAFFIKWFGDKNKTKANLLFDELTRKSILDRLPKTPLTLTLLAILYETKGDIPTTLTELYRMFSDLLLGKWDHKKGINTVKSSQVKFGLLSYLAWEMHRDGVGEISQDKLISLARDYLTLKLGDHETCPQELIQNIIDRSGLLVPENKQIKFKHFSFQEYFCSQEIYSKKIFGENLTEWVDDSWWSDVLFFSAGSLKSIDDHHQSLVNFIPKDKFAASLAIGGMLQAAYETSVGNKRELIRLTKTAIPAIIDEVVETLKSLSETKIPTFVPYAIVMEMLSDSFCSTYLEGPLRSEFVTQGEENIALSNLFIAASMAKSGNLDGLLEMSTTQDINQPVVLLLSDVMLDEYEARYNGGKKTDIHKTVSKKIRKNAKAVRAVLTQDRETTQQ